MSLYSKEELKKLELYEDKNISLSVLYGLEGKLQKALSDKVWLDSGAYLVIQPTEALVSIDVNTGKAIAGKQNTEETGHDLQAFTREKPGVPGKICFSHDQFDRL